MRCGSTVAPFCVCVCARVDKPPRLRSGSSGRTWGRTRGATREGSRERGHKRGATREGSHGRGHQRGATREGPQGRGHKGEVTRGLASVSPAPSPASAHHLDPPLYRGVARGQTIKVKRCAAAGARRPPWGAVWRRLMTQPAVSLRALAFDAASGVMAAGSGQQAGSIGYKWSSASPLRPVSPASLFPLVSSP